jgi:hypothetical protein
MRAVRAFLVLLMVGVLLTATPAGGDEPDKPRPVRVTVVVVRATAENNVVDKKLTALAKEVGKRDESLVGFQFDGVYQKSIPVGGAHEFDLIDGRTLTVTVDAPRDKTGRVGLTLTASTGASVSYTCACDKFFPMLTGHKTKAGEQVVVAVQGKPCTGKGP